MITEETFYVCGTVEKYTYRITRYCAVTVLLLHPEILLNLNFFDRLQKLRIHNFVSSIPNVIISFL